MENKGNSIQKGDDQKKNNREKTTTKLDFKQEK